MVNEFIVRIGTFFIVIGLGLFILFLATDYGNQTNFDYLCWSVLAVTLGIMMRRRKPPAPASGRFSGVRKLRERNKKQKEEKK